MKDNWSFEIWREFGETATRMQMWEDTPIENAYRTDNDAHGNKPDTIDGVIDAGNTLKVAVSDNSATSIALAARALATVQKYDASRKQAQSDVGTKGQRKAIDDALGIPARMDDTPPSLPLVLSGNTVGTITFNGVLDHFEVVLPDT